MDNLKSLGWDGVWHAHFEPFNQPYCFPGRIAVEHRELYVYYSEHGEGLAPVSGRVRHGARGRADFPAVGDWVVLRQERSDQQAVIQAILPRKNRFTRKAAGTELTEQIVAANLDTLFLVTSLNRDLNARRIERYLAAVSGQDLKPVLVLSKADLQDRPADLVAEFREQFPELSIHAVSAYSGEGLEELDPYLAPGQTIALVGSSGVGKSTLLKRLVGEQRLAVQQIREDDDRGRHTTTHREMIRLPQGGLLIDNPGMRELQLWDDGVNLDGTFSDISDLANACRFRDCSHRQEPGCAVQAALADGRLSAGRFESYGKLHRELAYLEAQQNPQVERERKDEMKRLFRQVNKVMRNRKKR